MVLFTASKYQHQYDNLSSDASIDDNNDNNKDNCFHLASNSRSESAVSNNKQSDENSISIRHQKYSVIGASINLG